MKKKWKLLLGIGVGLTLSFFLLLPGLIGIVLEKIMHQIMYVESSKKRTEHLYIQLTPIDYKRHWFYSDSSSIFSLYYPFLRYFLPTVNNVWPNIEIVTDSIFYHGPLMYVTDEKGVKTIRFGLGYSESKGYFNRKTQELITKNWEGKIPGFKSDTLVKFVGRFIWCNYTPSFEFKSKIDKTKISFGGSTMCADTNFKFSNVINDLKYKFINLDSPKLSLITSGFNIHYTEKKHMYDESPLWDGNYRLQAPDLYIKVLNNKFQFENIEWKSESHLNDTWYDINTNVVINNVIINTLDFGQLKYNGTFSQFYTYPFAKMRDFITLQSAALPLDEMWKLTIKHWPLISVFLSKSPKYDLQELSLNGPSGHLNVNGSLQLVLKNDKLSFTQVTSAIGNSLQELIDINASISTSISKSLADKLIKQYFLIVMGMNNEQTDSLETAATEKTTNIIKKWLAMRLLIEKNDEYITKLHYENNKFIQMLD